MVKNGTVIPSFGQAKRQGEVEGPHIKAGKRLNNEMSTMKKPSRSKGNKKKASRACQRYVKSEELDEKLQSKFESKETLFFYNDKKGISLTYPKDTEKISYKSLPLSNLELVKNHDDENNFNVVVGHPKGNKNEKTFIVLKVSKAQKKGSSVMMKKHHKLLEDLLVKMPNVKRGGMRSGVESKYVCVGSRKNPLDCELGQYAFKPGVSETDKLAIKEGIMDLVNTLESKSMNELDRAHLKGDQRADFARVQQKFGLPSISEDGVATQFSLAKGYSSPVHVDNDAFYSTLSVYDETATEDQVLYHFCFPTYGIAIPMRSGDIIVFNPLVPHCATNPRVKTALIYSMYVSNKTCHTQIASLEKNGNDSE